MPKSSKQHQKRAKDHSSRGGSFSRSLRAARDLIGEGKRDQGLASLNLLAKTVNQPSRRGRIALLIGESEASFSRYNEAATAYSKASSYGRQSGDADLILAGGLGEIRVLLLGLRTEDAKNTAAALLIELNAAQQALQAVLNLSPQQVANQVAVQVPPRPPRPTVGLTRIATAFQEAGLMTEAKAFLEKAVVLSPNGASRARQQLARIALASDDPSRAEALAREALQMGRFQAKTIAAWPLYLDARARQGLTPLLDPLLYESFVSNTTGRIRASSVLSMVRVLRGHGDTGWKPLAEQFLANSRSLDPVTATEIEKILHANAKLTNSDTKITLAARSLRLFRDPKASPNEQVAHAKSYVRYSLESGNQPDVAGLKRMALSRFTPAQAISVRHAAALGAMNAEQYDTARVWLLQLITDLQPGEPAWGRSKWALARMEALLERNSQAASGYLEVAANAQIPPRFRIQAMLRGLKFLTKAGGFDGDVTTICNSVRSILVTSDDHAVILDAARQLSLAGAPFAGLKREASNQGSRLADQAIASASSAREALRLLEYLTRKLYWDIGDIQGVLTRWDSLDEKRRAEFRANGGSVWYEYLSVVFRALVAADRGGEATDLASTVIDGDHATPEGYVIVGSEYASWLMRHQQAAKAFEHFEWISKEAPTHRKAAVAHYWLALRSIKLGNMEEVTKSANAIRKCFAGAPSLLTEWELEAKATYFLNKNEGLISGNIILTKEFIIKSINDAERDMSIIN